MSRLFLAAILASLPIAAVASALAPSAILANPSTYDGKPVIVSGAVSNFAAKDTKLGKFTRFDLCDAKCVPVLDMTGQTHTNGSMATVSGTFHATFKAPQKTWNNVIIVGQVPTPSGTH
jgi:hypothetical protein